MVGVGAVVLDRNGRVLLAKRAHEPLKGEWSLPGGAVEVGEALEAAVIREVLEETGVQVEVDSVVEVFDRIDRAPDGRVAYHFVIIDFLCHERGGIIACGSDAEDAKWVSPGELAGYRLTEKAAAVIGKAITLASSRADTREPREGR
jgi:mutator protein MutT